MNKIDNIINESILYNDIIGPKPNCKFKNFHSFIDYIILNITQLNNFKEKSNSIDFKTLFQSNHVKKENIEELFKTYSEIIFQLKIKNIKYIDDIKINFENIIKIFYFYLPI